MIEIPRWLKQQKHYAGRSLTHAVALGVTASYLLIAQAWLLAQVINDVVFEDASLSEKMPLLWMMLGLFFVRAVLTHYSEQVAFRAAVKVKLALRDELFAHLQTLAGSAWLDKQGSGELATTLMDGIESLENYYARYLPAMSLVVLAPLSILVFIFPSDWISGVVMLLTAPLIPFFMMLIGSGAEKKNQQQWRQLSRMSVHLLDMIQGLTTLKLFNASRREAQAIATISERYRESTMSVLRVAFLSSFALEFFSTISIAVVAVLVGFRLFWGDLDFLYGFFVLLLAPEFYLPLRNMGTHYHARMEAIGAATKIVEVLNIQAEQRSADTEISLPPGQLDIALQGVDYCYDEGPAALDGICLDISAGQNIAIVGKSGAGKSTLIKVLLGFLVPQQGKIFAAGADITALSQDQWRHHLSWVPQKPRLFHGTIADNIRLGMPDASIAQLKQAAIQANAAEFIEGFKQGYNTLVGDSGQGLSGGQIQRIALARAFLKDAPLLIMDEPTAHLDSESEDQILQAIVRLSRNRTVITIAHRLKTVEHVDKIVVLDQGRIVEQGRHDQLVEQAGHYHGMLKTYGRAT